MCQLEGDGVSKLAHISDILDPLTFFAIFVEQQFDVPKLHKKKLICLNLAKKAHVNLFSFPFICGCI